MMLRTADGTTSNPMSSVTGSVVIRDVSRADWSLMVSLLQHRPGPDPRVSTDASAVGAENTSLELLSRQEKGTCKLSGAFCGDRLVSLASVATDQLGERTYAMLMPCGDSPPTLREAVIEFARSKGYAQVDFPMETLGEAQAEQPAPAEAPPEPAADAPDDTAP
jgi:hypothetical protein